MSDVRPELQTITDEIMELGRQIEVKRAAALEIARGMLATERRGTTFKIENTRLTPGTWRLFFEGPALKKDGQPHARSRVSCPLGLLKFPPS